MTRAKPSDRETLTPADAKAWLRSAPFPGYPALVLHGLIVLAANAYVFRLLISGQLPPAGLILLVAIEFLGLMVLLRLLGAAVPPSDWFEAPKPLRAQLPIFAFLPFWCGGAYSLTLVVIDGWGDMLVYFREPQVWFDTGLVWALAISFGLALCGGLNDWLRYRRLGPPYIPSAASDTLARLLTLIFGGIPFAMPFFIVAFGGIKAVEWVFKRAKRDLNQSVLGAVAFIACAYGGFAIVGLLIGAGVDGWSIGFVLAKLLAELALVAIPLVMREVASEDVQPAKP
jgi:hypothetical protein